MRTVWFSRTKFVRWVRKRTGCNRVEAQRFWLEGLNDKDVPRRIRNGVVEIPRQQLPDDDSVSD